MHQPQASGKPSSSTPPGTAIRRGEDAQSLQSASPGRGSKEALGWDMGGETQGEALPSTQGNTSLCSTTQAHAGLFRGVMGSGPPHHLTKWEPLISIYLMRKQAERWREKPGFLQVAGPQSLRQRTLPAWSLTQPLGLGAWLEPSCSDELPGAHPTRATSAAHAPGLSSMLAAPSQLNSLSVSLPTGATPGKKPDWASSMPGTALAQGTHKRHMAGWPAE